MAWALIGTACLNVRFPGQYYDDETGLHYNLMRYYHPELGRYIQSDPIGLAGGLSTYGYALNNPTTIIDPHGLAGCYVLFPDYPIEYQPGRTSTWLGGHAGVLGWDSSGSTRYYEFGRYGSAGQWGRFIGPQGPGSEGNIRRLTIPDLEIGPDGNPTAESWQNLLDALSQRAGRNTDTDLDCDEDANENDIYDFIDRFANNPERPNYSWYPWSANHCRTFASDAFGAGQ